jgi:hypothetical protein
MKMKIFSISLLLICTLISSSCKKDMTSLESKNVLKVTYEFTGKIEYFYGDIPFSVQLNDGISGMFSYNPNVPYYQDQTQTCSYFNQDSTFGAVLFVLRDIAFKANVDSIPEYSVEICNNVPETGGSDTFRWAAGFPDLKEIYGLSYLYAIFRLSDPSGTAILDHELPTHLNSDGFQYKQFFINGSIYKDTVEISFFTIRAKLNDVELKSIMYE